jgi:hypothetical protein
LLVAVPVWGCPPEGTRTSALFFSALSPEVGQCPVNYIIYQCPVNYTQSQGPNGIFTHLFWKGGGGAYFPPKSTEEKERGEGKRGEGKRRRKEEKERGEGKRRDEKGNANF